MDKIILPAIEVVACHGVNPEEKVTKQPFIIATTLYLDLKPAAASDDLGKTINYGLLYQRIKEFAENSSFNLIETLAGRIIDLVFEDERICRAKVKVIKTQARLDNYIFPAAVVIVRTREEQRKDKKKKATK